MRQKSRSSGIAAKEPVRRNGGKLTAEEIRALRLFNTTGSRISHGPSRFEDVLELTKNRCILNLDRCAGFFDDVAKIIRRHGMENQILMKSKPTRDAIARIADSEAAGCMYIPILNETSEGWEMVQKSGLNVVGAELTFASEESPLMREDFMGKLHREGLAVWVNALVYDYEVRLTAGHDDDVSVTGDPADGWGWLIERGADIIQTDWTGLLHRYLEGRGLAEPGMTDIRGMQEKIKEKKYKMRKESKLCLKEK